MTPLYVPMDDLGVVVGPERGRGHKRCIKIDLALITLPFVVPFDPEQELRVSGEFTYIAYFTTLPLMVRSVPASRTMNALFVLQYLAYTC